MTHGYTASVPPKHMSKCLLAAILCAALLQPAGVAAQRRVRAGGPLRVVLLVDSSVSARPMLQSFREGLRGFLEDLPGDPEIALFTTGGGFRIRAEPTSDREVIEDAVARFTPDGGSNALLRSLLEADSRFFWTDPDRRPIVVILATDMNTMAERTGIASYNEFLGEFIAGGGRAHAIIIRGINPPGLVTKLTENLTRNTGGFFETVVTDLAIPKLMKTVALYVAADQ